MASVFCTSCGAKHEYAGFAPNFCSKCGNPMNGKAPAQLQKKPTRAASSDDIEDEKDRVIFIRSVCQLFATKARIQLNPKKLYEAQGFAVKEMLKIAIMMYKAV